MTQRLTFYGFLKLVRPVLAASVLGLIAFVRLAAAHPFIIDQSSEPSSCDGFVQFHSGQLSRSVRNSHLLCHA